MATLVPAPRTRADEHRREPVLSAPPRSNLADDLFMLGRRPGGQLLAHPRALGLGLAAGLVGELILAGNLTIAACRVVVLDRSAPSDALAHLTHDQIVAEHRPRDVQRLLAVLSDSAEEQVGQRLVRAGSATRQIVRWRRPPVRWVPTDPLAPEKPVARLYGALSRHEALPDSDAVLAGVAAGIGLAGAVLFDGGRASRRRLRARVESLPRPLGGLLAALDAATGQLHRR